MTGTSDVVRAYELACYADNALRAGRVAEARKLMAEAAALDGGYAVRAAHLGEKDERRKTVGRTLARLVVKPLVAAGCRIEPRGSWSPTSYLVRDCPPWILHVYVGTVKFGGAISVNASRWTDPKDVQYFAFADVGLPRGQICYSTQAELEEACERWRDLLLASVLPWGAGQGAGQQGHELASP